MGSCALLDRLDGISCSETYKYDNKRTAPPMQVGTSIQHSGGHTASAAVRTWHGSTRLCRRERRQAAGCSAVDASHRYGRHPSVVSNTSLGVRSTGVSCTVASYATRPNAYTSCAGVTAMCLSAVTAATTSGAAHDGVQRGRGASPADVGCIQSFSSRMNLRTSVFRISRAKSRRLVIIWADATICWHSPRSGQAATHQH